MKILIRIFIALNILCTAPSLQARDSKIDKARYKDAFWGVLANLAILRVECASSKSGTCGPRAPEFIGRLKSHYDAIDHRFPGREELSRQIDDLQKLIESQSAPRSILEKSFAFERALLIQLDAMPLPAESLNREIGRDKYLEHCASCHGSTGVGDGTLAPKLRTPLRSFKDVFRESIMTPLSTYAVLVNGSRGTEMTPFIEALSQEEMWSVAYYVSLLPHAAAEHRVSDECNRAISKSVDLNKLMISTDVELAEAAAKIPNCSVNVDYLRSHSTFDSDTARELTGEIAARGSKSGRGLAILSGCVFAVLGLFAWVLTRRSRVK